MGTGTRGDVLAAFEGVDASSFDGDSYCGVHALAHTSTDRTCVVAVYGLSFVSPTWVLVRFFPCGVLLTLRSGVRASSSTEHSRRSYSYRALMLVAVFVSPRMQTCFSPFFVSTAFVCTVVDICL